MPYIGKGGNNGFGIRERYRYSASGSQTAFTGSDLDSKTLQFDSGSLLDVYLNGVLLDTADYNTSTANTVTLTSGATASDEVMIVVYDVFSLSDAMPKTGGALSGTITNFTSTGIDDNADATAITIDSSELVGIGTTTPSSYNQNGNGLVVKKASVDGNTSGISIVSGTSATGNIYFSDATGNSLSGGAIEYNHSSNRMNLYANNALGMRIDEDGNVTKPLQPAFQAYYASNSYCYSDTTDGAFDLLTLNQTRFNIGNHYNTTNHRFIAPVAGRYYFYGQFYTNYESNYARAGAGIFVNGSQMSRTWNPGTDTPMTGHTAITLSLAVDDYVQLYVSVYDANATSNTYNLYCGALNTYLIGHLIG